jgi:hypothetical protein
MSTSVEAIAPRTSGIPSRGLGARISLLFLASLIFAGWCAFSPRLAAQTVNATLRGAVADASGGVIPNASVTLIEPATGRTVQSLKSMSTGDFEFDELKPGSYEIQCSAPGFKLFVANDIVLEGGQVRRLNVAMTLGETSQSVTVNAGSAAISTESATLSGTFTAKQFQETPQVTIYPTTFSMLTTLAGVQGGVGGFPVIDGEQQTEQTETFDGIPNDLEGQQSNNANFFEEVSATMSNAPAESPVPAEINQITKRGSNKFHGRASYRIYDSVLDANGYFDTTKTPYLQHEWDLEASGPIWKDKTFFYGAWFAQRIPLGTQFQASVPTLNWRQGVFATPIIDPQTGLPFPNNTIPANRISPVALATQSNYLPVPNVNTTQPVNNLNYFFPFNSDLYRGDWPIVRVDHNLTKNNSLFVRWLMRQTPYVLNNGLPALVWTRSRRHQQWAAGDTQIFGPHVINNFRFGYSIDYIVDGQPEAGQTPPDGSKVLTTIGLQGANPGGQTGQGFPEIDIAGLTSLSNVPGGVKDDNHIVTFNDSVDWQIGRHTLKIGGRAERFQIYQGTIPNYGTFTFDGSSTSNKTVTGNSYADFLLGLPEESQRSSPLPGEEQKLNEYGLFAEDSFKVNDKLTVNYGVRWDLYGTPSSSSNLMYNFDPATGDVIVDPKAISQVSPLYPDDPTKVPPSQLITVIPGQVQAISDKANFVPRIGAAYLLTPHSVLRGGYGIYTARFGSLGTYNNFLPINPLLGSTGPFSISQVYESASTPGGLSFPDPYPDSTASAQVPSQSVTGYPRQMSHGHIQQFSVTFEHEVDRFGLRASYVGSRSSGLDYQLNTNLAKPGLTAYDPTQRPYQQFVDTTMLEFNGSAKFDSLQLEAKRRVAGFTLEANYSLSRSTQNDLDVENPYDVLSHWANDGVTRRNYASASVVYSLPFGQGKRFLGDSGPMLDRAVGGWSTSVITYLASGLYFSPSFDSADPSNTGTFGGLPDKIGNPNNVPGGKSKTDWFNTAAFAVPQPGTFGNALPNSLESQNLYITHLSLTKSVPLTDWLHFQFVTQMSNLFNHPQFLSPSGDISAAGGNQFTSQFGTFDSLEGGQQRQITFQGAFTF